LFKPVLEVLSKDFLTQNGISQTDGLTVFVQNAQDPDFDPSSLHFSSSACQGKDEGFLSQNIHMPHSRDYIVYYFLRSNS
jgi:hypothetical protein